MDGASLPVLPAPQTLNSTAAGAASPASAADHGDGFAAILGATELTGLTADQQAALRQLLAGPAGTPQPVAGLDGKGLPQAAIRGLLEILGIDVDLDAMAPGASVGIPEDAAAANPGPPGESDAGAGLAAVLAMLFPTAARPAPAPSPAGSGRGPAPEPLRVARSLLDPMTAGTGAGATDTAAPADAQRSLPVGALWQLIQRSAALADSGHPAHARPAAVSSGPGAPAVARPEVPDPTALLAAAATAAGDTVTAPDLVADLARDLTTALDSAPGAAGRSALAATAELVPARATNPASTAVSVPVGERGWERAFGERVVWLVSQQVQTAEVKLNPPHLGPVEVRLSLNGQDASVSFTVAHGATRDAIEQAIPRLRELFAEQQLQIVNVDVGQRDAAGQASQGERWGHAARPVSGAVAHAGAADSEPVVRGRGGGLPGLVDEYA